MTKYGNLPNELKQLDNWVCFRLMDNGDGKKPTKVPINAKTGKAAASNDTATVLYLCAACFVKAKLWDRGIKFPILIMIGEAGSGKSTTYEKVIAPLFLTEVSFGASRMTQFTVIQTASSSNCILFAIDEYMPSTMDKFKLDLINNFLRDSYDCHEATRGNVDMTVRSYPLISPV